MRQCRQASVRPKWAGLCAPILGMPLCAHGGQASVWQKLAHQVVAFSDYHIYCAYFNLCAMSLAFYAPILGMPLRAQSGQAFVHPKWAGLCAPKVGRPLCAHGGQAPVRPWCAGFCAPKVGNLLCVRSGLAFVPHGGQAFVRPKWAGLCAAISCLRATLIAMCFYRCICAPPYSEPLRVISGFFAYKVGRPMCVHSWQASVRP